MKPWLIVIPLLFVAACGGVRTTPVQTLALPPLDTAAFNDTPFTAGWEALRAGRASEAFRLFEQSTCRDDRKHMAFGYVFLSEGRLDEARRQFEQAMQLNRDNSLAEIGLAMTHEQAGETESAFLVYGRLVTRYPDHPLPKSRYEAIRNQATQEYLKKADEAQSAGDKKELRRSLEKAAFYSPERRDIKTRIADALYQDGEYNAVLPHLEALLEAAPTDTALLEKLGGCYEQLHKLDAALMVYSKLAVLQPDNPAVQSKRGEIKTRFMESNLPAKFKNIFFKDIINREELAALTAFYFDPYLKLSGTPEILTDIDGSFAKEAIIRVCSAGIMRPRPDHTFDRFGQPDRSLFVDVLTAILDYLDKQGKQVLFTPPAQVVEPVDIPVENRQARSISFLVNAGILTLDDQKRFQPSLPLHSTEVVQALRKIMLAVQQK